MKKDKFKELLNDLKSLVRNMGRSNLIHKSEIQEIIDNFEGDEGR